MHAYTRLAIILHWMIATAIAGNLAIGWWMHQAIDEPASRAAAVQVFQFHKSLGLSILALSLLRLCWRLLHRAPALPAGMPVWERAAAQAAHAALYALMILLPLSGWIYASTQWRGDNPLTIPTLWFGLFPVPHLFGLADAAFGTRQWVAHWALQSHEWLAWSFCGLLAVHVGAALRHQFLRKDDLLRRMVPRDGAALFVLPVLLVSLGMAGGIIQAVSAPSAVDGSSSETESSGNWVVEPGASFIRFHGSHAGSPFTGQFGRWRLHAEFEPQPGSAVLIETTIATASARDGVTLHDETLPEAEWFDVARYPQASFRAAAVLPAAGEPLPLDGELTIKDRTERVSGLQLVLIDQRSARIHGRVELDRATFDLGQESDPNGEWVSQRIGVEIDVLLRAR